MQLLKKISHKYRWLGGLAAIMSFCWWSGVYARKCWEYLQGFM